jgi:Fe-S-cluster containining protein
LESIMKTFECRLCGACCYGEGGIFLTGNEERRIADFLGISVEIFLQQHCETRHGRVYLRVGEGNYCIFYDQEKKCGIHPVKPERCSLWPYYPALVRDRENWELAMDACPGINPDASFEDFVKEAGK